jgi:hypothetical protein
MRSNDDLEQRDWNVVISIASALAIFAILTITLAML